MDHIHVIDHAIENEETDYDNLLYIHNLQYIEYKKWWIHNTAAVMHALRDLGREEANVRLVDDIHEGRTGRTTLRKQSDKFPFWKMLLREYAVLPKLRNI